MQRKNIYIIGAVCILLIAGAILFIASRPDSGSNLGDFKEETKKQQPKIMTPKEAANLVQRFAKTTGFSKIVKAKVKSSSDKNASDELIYKVLTKAGKLYEVNTKTKKVTEIKTKSKEEAEEILKNSSSSEKADADNWKNETPDPKDKGYKITNDEALRLAEELAKSEYSKFGDLTLHSVIDRGEVLIFFWRKIDENGAILPTIASDAVNLKTKKASNFNIVEEDVSIDTKPKITKSQAEETAKKLLQKDQKIKRTDLYVLKDFEEAENLVWLVQIEGFESATDGSQTPVYINKMINAVSGKDITIRF